MAIDPQIRTPRTCLRCGHSWNQNARTKDGRPKQCPECHSPYWHRKKTKFKKSLVEEARAILSGPKLSMQDFEKELKR